MVKLNVRPVEPALQAYISFLTIYSPYFSFHSPRATTPDFVLLFVLFFSIFIFMFIHLQIGVVELSIDQHDFLIPTDSLHPSTCPCIVLSASISPCPSHS